MATSDRDSAADREAAEEAALAEALGALANATRLAVLRRLRSPQTLGRITVHQRTPAGRGAAEGPPLSRQGVREHLDRLLEAGFVVDRPVEGERGPTSAYSVNHSRLYAVAEDLKALALLRPTVEVEARTVDARRAAARSRFRGPCLIQVKGAEEGLVYDLRSGTPSRTKWVIGRRRASAVTLDYDPYVSTEHAVVALEESRFWIRDLPESRNGTILNFQPLAKGERHPLENGDLVGVGRTLLLFRA